MAKPRTLNQQAVVDAISKTLLPSYLAERERLDLIDKWMRWEQELPKAPPGASAEHRALLELAKTPVLRLVVKTTVQGLGLTGWQSGRTAPAADPNENRPGDDVGIWHYLQANDVPGFHENRVHEAAVGYGYAYTKILPGLSPFGQPMPVIRGVSPRNMMALYADPIEDDWPMLALQVRVMPDRTVAYTLFDEVAVYSARSNQLGDTVGYLDTQIHGAGFCPVVRFTNSLDLDGRADGEVDPYIGVAKRINKTTYDRLLIQHFNSWKIRFIAGLEAPEEIDGQELTAAQKEEWRKQARLRLRHEDLLIANDPDTKFGTLDASSAEPIVKAKESDYQDLSAISQTPIHNFGVMINLSADALAAADAGANRKQGTLKTSLGKGWNQTGRAAAAIAGNRADADDYLGSVTWADKELRSLSATADALGKLALQLGIPPEGLWDRIPGATESDFKRWRTLLEQQDPLTKLTEQLARNTAPTPEADPADGPPPTAGS